MLQSQKLLSQDKRLSKSLATWGNGRLPHSIAWLIARTGDSLTWILIVAWLFWQKEPIAWHFVWAMVVTASITFVAKSIFKRQRPAASKAAISHDKYSFPSGHSARAMGLAVTLTFHYPQFVLFFLLWAVTIAIARVVLARHYLSDVVVGLILGGIVAFILQSVIL